MDIVYSQHREETTPTGLICDVVIDRGAPLNHGGETLKKTEVLVDGLKFPESPRWHDGKLWFSDILDCRVLVLGEDGAAHVVAQVPRWASGLGWDPGGGLLIVSVPDSRILRFKDGVLEEAANLTDCATVEGNHRMINDMIVSRNGDAYVGVMVYEVVKVLEMPAVTATRRLIPPAPTGDHKGPISPLIHVDPSGRARVVSNNLVGPNGMAITADGETLLVAETDAKRLTAFRLDENGNLHDQRVFAELEASPDGMCLDEEGAVWVALEDGMQFIRVAEGGSVLDRVDVGPDRIALACVLGGADRRTLYMCTAEELDPTGTSGRRTGRIEAVSVEVPGSGLP